MKKCQLKNYLKGSYTTDTSDLKIIIHKVYYQNEEYFKARYTLVNKHNGITYDQNRTNKFYFKLIGHWKACEKECFCYEVE